MNCAFLVKHYAEHPKAEGWRTRSHAKQKTTVVMTKELFLSAQPTILFEDEYFDNILNLFQDQLKKYPAYKVSLNCLCVLEKPSDLDVTEEIRMPFSSFNHQINRFAPIEESLTKMINEMLSRYEDMKTRGSGWSLKQLGKISFCKITLKIFLH